MQAFAQQKNSSNAKGFRWRTTIGPTTIIIKKVLLLLLLCFDVGIIHYALQVWPNYIYGLDFAGPGTGLTCGRVDCHHPHHIHAGRGGISKELCTTIDSSNRLTFRTLESSCITILARSVVWYSTRYSQAYCQVKCMNETFFQVLKESKFVFDMRAVDSKR